MVGRVFYHVLLVIFLLSISSFTYALEKTSTGFYWPIGVENFNEADGGWLERDTTNGGGYFDGLYHIGVDMMTSGSIYAISDGVVFHKDVFD